MHDLSFAGGSLPFLLLALALGLVLWFVLGPGAQRRRASRRAQRFLRQGQWSEALTLIEKQHSSKLTPMWEEVFRKLQGQAHRLAAEQALAEQRYEEGLEQHRHAARLLPLNETEVVANVIETMLDQVRRLFSLNTPAGTDAALALVGRILKMQDSCAEGLFWQGLCHVRRVEPDLALAALRTAHECAEKRFVDPPLYLGALFLRRGQAEDAVRYLSEANRVAPASPLVTWQLGTAILAAGGDCALAVRALQRALERFPPPRSRELGNSTNQQLAWSECLPDTHSYVRSLAVRYPYNCPVLGNNLALITRQARLALAQAQLRCGNSQEAASLFAKLMEESPPTVPLLRGLGQALARLERYEDAYKHLRTAYDQESPPNPLTASYLALCAAKGMPTQPEVRAKNVAWAVHLLSQFHVPTNAEWASVCNAVHAEARSLGLPIPTEDQLRLCDALAAVQAADARAAAAYEHLMASAPAAVRPEHAWLYCRAAQQHRLRGGRELDLFALTFSHAAAARTFYEQRQWDFNELEYAYLERQADRLPGHFPELLGADYSTLGEEMLLKRSRAEEIAGRKETALAAAEILCKLAPGSSRGLDHLAGLCYRHGDLERAAALLTNLHALNPQDPLPLIRRAVVERQRDNRAGYIEAIEQALACTSQHDRAAVAFLGARLALRDDWTLARRWLSECLHDDPSHNNARWCLAAVHSLLGDQEGLKALASSMSVDGVADGRFYYLAAHCQLTAGDYCAALAAARRAAEVDPALAKECAYLEGRAHLHLNNAKAAAQALELASHASDGASPSLDHARALLGVIRFRDNAYEDTLRFWNALDPQKRAAWTLAVPLRETVFLSGLQALDAGHFAKAAGRFREARRHAIQDKALDSLLILALVREGQRLLRTGEVSASAPAEADLQDAGSAATAGPEDPETKTNASNANGKFQATDFLEQALGAGCQDPNVTVLLARAYRRQGKFRLARKVLQALPAPNANVLLELGLLSLAEGQMAQAEGELAGAREQAPHSYEICHNLLFTRLSLGHVESALPLLAEMIELAPISEDRRCYEFLRDLLPAGQSVTDRGASSRLREMTAEDEQRLLMLICSLGDLGLVDRLLLELAHSRSGSPVVREAYFDTVLLDAKALFDHGEWDKAERLLLAHADETSGAKRIAFLNLLGCCACLCQNFLEAVQHFKAALRLCNSDPRIEQNLALAYEWHGQWDQAAAHWDLYVKQIDREPPNGSAPMNYEDQRVFAAVDRLARICTEKERWSVALLYAQHAARLRPADPQALERLFRLYNHSRRPKEARPILERLRQVRPDDALNDLLELDLIDTRGLDGIERFVVHLERVLKHRPEDMGVEARVLPAIEEAVQLQGQAYRQLAERLAKIVRQVDQLPGYQIDWSAVHDATVDIHNDYIKLRRIGGRCLPLLRDERQRRVLREQAERIERRIKQCQELEE